jgi:Concanavalin A-like lectin/glucanases superfamily
MKSKIRAAVALVVVMFCLVIAIHLLDKQKRPKPGNMGPNSDIASSTTGAPVSGLVAAYSFNEGAGSTAADASGNGHTGTIINAVWTKSGKYGNALVFNGHDALVTIADAAALHLTTGMTLEAWVNPFAIPQANCIPTSTCYWMDVIHKDSDRYYIEASSNQNEEPEAGGIFVRPWTLLHFHSRSGKHILYGRSALPLNTWTHLALTYDGAMLRFYVNGAVVSSSPESFALTTSTNPLCIGGDPTQGQFFNGIIDEVRIYSVALTGAQIQSDLATAIGPHN